MNTIGERIKHIRKTNKLSQADFGNSLCISRPHVSNIENDREKPSDTVIRLISYIFDISENWLHNGK